MSSPTEKHQAVFDLIDKAGGVKLKGIRALSFGERMKVTFNAPAFLFGIFYYIYAGMWKKGIVLTAIGVILTTFFSEFFPNLLGSGVWVITPVILGTRANIDLYKRYKLGMDGWV